MVGGGKGRENRMRVSQVARYRIQAGAVAAVAGLRCRWESERRLEKRMREEGVIPAWATR